MSEKKIKTRRTRIVLKDLEYGESPEDEVKISEVKKGPGRPRKTPKKEPIPRDGISDTPQDHDHVVEFLYEQPLILKKIISFFCSLAASQIQIIFRPTDVIFYSHDHHGKTHIRVKIDANKLNHYYCKNTVDIGLNCRDLALIFNIPDKDYNSVIMLITKNNVQKHIDIIMENDIQIDEHHTIDVVGRYIKMNDEADFIDDDYTITFNLPGKYFKKTISDIRTISKQLSIQQDDEDADLEFCYNSSNKKVRSRHVFKNSGKVKLASKLKEGYSFRVDVKVDYIRPISSANIADRITVMVDEDKKLMTCSSKDNNTIEIKTLTEIIDFRDEEVI